MKGGSSETLLFAGRQEGKGLYGVPSCLRQTTQLQTNFFTGSHPHSTQ